MMREGKESEEDNEPKLVEVPTIKYTKNYRSKGYNKSMKNLIIFTVLACLSMTGLGANVMTFNSALNHMYVTSSNNPSLYSGYYPDTREL